MSEHQVRIAWDLAREPFEYGKYNLEHQVTFEGGRSVTSSGAPAFGGDAQYPNPEDALVWALSSCHMLTFLAIAARRGLVVEHYEDHAVGHLEKNDQGKLALTRVVLRPVVRFRDEPPSAQTIQRIHESSHRECFIANSVLTQVTVESG